MKKFSILAAVAALFATPAVAKSPTSAVYKVQQDVNSSIVFRAEPDGQDFWQIPTLYGDCEDFAMLKRKILIEKYGFEPADLQVLLLYKPNDKKVTYEGHTVLYVKSLDLVLDNSSSPDQKVKPMPTKLDLFLKRGNYNLRCVLGNLELGATKGSVSTRCA